MCEQTLECCTKNTALRDLGANNDGGRAVMVKPGMLRHISKNIFNSVAKKGSQTQCLQFVDQFIGSMVLNPELQSTNNILT